MILLILIYNVPSVPRQKPKSSAVKKAISNLIKIAKRTNTKVGICGQGPSDHQDFAEFLVEEGIDSISVTPDSVLKTILSIASLENK
jgi:pyruvate,water dikinase